MLSLMEIEFIVARNAAKGFIPAKYSEAMVSLQGGDCRPTKRRVTRSGQLRDVSTKYGPFEAGRWKNQRLSFRLML
jgi:hypothetical protein